MLQVGDARILPAEGLLVSANLNLTHGGAAKNLDWLCSDPQAPQCSVGLRKPSEILIRASLYQRM